MKAPAGMAAALALAACGGPAAPPPGNSQTEPAAAPTPQANAKTMGTTSGLAGQVSPLTGEVSDFEVTVTETATVVALAADTLFAFDEATLSPNAVPNLQRTAALIRKGGAGAVAVIGHTDAKGDDAYNQALSQRRAAAVADWIRQQDGLASRSITVAGKGETEPVAPNAKPDGSDDPEGRARNRRVVVEIPKS